MVVSNFIFYVFGEYFDYVIVIKYVFYVGDSKRVMDEYIFEIFMGGCNIIVMYNICEDFFLVVFFIFDLVLLVEFCIWI